MYNFGQDLKKNVGGICKVKYRFSPLILLFSQISGHRNKKNGLTNGSTTTKSTSFPGAISHSRSRSEPAIHADLEVATTGIFIFNLDVYSTLHCTLGI